MKHIGKALAVSQSVLFHPVIVLLTSAMTTAVFVMAMWPFRWLLTGIPNWQGDSQRVALLYYHAPIVLAFVPYVFDRAQHWRRITWAQWLVEVPVIGLALVRVIRPLPFYSGHAIFLAYAMLTMSSWTARFMVVAVLVDVVYFKITFFQDATLVGGLVNGVLAGVLVRYLQFRASGRMATPHVG